MHQARLRQATYRLLASLFLYPNQERLTTLRSVAQDLQADQLWSSSAIAQPLGQLLQILSELSDGPHSSIEEAYVDLFAVKPKAPPYESFYQDPEGYARGWIAVQLDREYADAGLALSKTHKEPPDHVAVELEFMAYLCALEAQAEEMGEAVGIDQAQRRQHAFLQQHLGRWFPQFAERIMQATPLSIYQKVAETATNYLDQQIEMLC